MGTVGPDFDRLVDHGFLPDIDAEQPTVEVPAEVRRELGHVSDVLDTTVSEPTPPVRGVNEHGYPKTLPTPIIDSHIILGDK